MNEQRNLAPHPAASETTTLERSELLDGAHWRQEHPTRWSTEACSHHLAVELRQQGPLAGTWTFALDGDASPLSFPDPRAAAGAAYDMLAQTPSPERCALPTPDAALELLVQVRSRPTRRTETRPTRRQTQMLQRNIIVGILRDYLALYRGGERFERILLILRLRWPRGRRFPAEQTIWQHLSELIRAGWLVAVRDEYTDQHGPVLYRPRKAPVAPATHDPAYVS